MMPAIPDLPKSPQAPIFQRSPDLTRSIEAAEADRKARIQARRDTVRLPPSDIPAQPVTLALVTPLSIFAAGHSSFEVIVRGPFGAREALAVIFSRLPLEGYGWEFDRTDINLSGHVRDFPVWRVSQERSFIADPDAQAEQKPLAPSAKPVKTRDHQISCGGRG
jgi:hypothetical protein